MGNSNSFIPLVDLKAQYASIESEIKTALEACLKSTAFILGPDVEAFEREFAGFCGARFVAGCGSGTEAIHLACRALGIGPGDEVIVPAMTFVSSAAGVWQAGAKPVLADVEPETALLDPDATLRAITPATSAILPVHLYGQMADMRALGDIAKEKGLLLIEDAAQAHGARRDGLQAGNCSDAACFSFYPGKNLGAYGDGGCVTTNREDVFHRILMLRNIGSVKKYHHEKMGINSRLDTVQAAVLRVKLPNLAQWNARRAALAAEYEAALSSIRAITLTRSVPGSVFHLYALRVKDRDNALDALNQAGIGAGVHYPFALHELDACRFLGYAPDDFSVARDWARRTLSLPLYPELPEEAIARSAAVLSRIAH